MPAPEVLIIGGGPSGLLAAHHLRQRGLAVEVREAGAVPGGWAQTWSWPGPEGEPGHLERGPQTLVLTRHGALSRLVAHLALPLEPLGRHGPRWVLDAAGLHPWPTGLGWLGTPLLTPFQKLRLLLEPLVPGSRGEASLADLARRRMGHGWAERIFPPLVGSLLGADPGTLDPMALPSLTRADRFGGQLQALLLHGVPRRFRIEGGMGRLARALAADAVHLHSPALRITRVDEAWQVEGPGWSQRAPRVVLALPAEVAACLLLPLAPWAASGLREMGSLRLWIRHTRHAPTLPDLGLRVHPACDSECLGLQARRQGPWLQATTYFRRREGTTPPLPDLGDVLQERWTEARMPCLPLGQRARIQSVLSTLPPGLDAIGAWRWGPGLADLAEGAEVWARG